MQDLSTGWLDCDPGPLFKPDYFTVPEWFPSWVSEPGLRKFFSFLLSLLAYFTILVTLVVFLFSLIVYKYSIKVFL